MTGVFLQVRLDSTRYPRKALADLGGRTVLQRCLDALEGVPAQVHAVVTEPGSLEELSPLVRTAGWQVFSGSRTDVLDRYVQAARFFGCSTVVRATGDNPLVSARLARLLIEKHRAEKADYSGFQGGPHGSGVEIIRVAALEQAWQSAKQDFEREHVCPYLYGNPQLFRLCRPEVPPPSFLPEARVTLDTAADYLYLQRLWSENYRGIPLEIEDLVPWLKTHPH